MATGGTIGVKDLLPVPDSLAPVTEPGQGETSQTLADEPTLSHALAVADHDEKGHAQESHDSEVKDLGWNEAEDEIANPLVGRLPNEDLWILIRRFNKACFPQLPTHTMLIRSSANVPREGAYYACAW